MTLSMYYIIVFPTTSLMIFTCNSFHCSCCIYTVLNEGHSNRIGHENLFFAITYYAWSPSDIISNSSYLLQQITVQISTTNGLEAQNE